MAYYSPKFIGRWIQIARQVHLDEQAFPKKNMQTNQILTRIVSRDQVTCTYEKRTDADNPDVDGDKLAIEELNLPDQGNMYGNKLVSLKATYDLATGVVTCIKVLREEGDTWHKVADLEPIDADDVQTG